MDSLLRPLTFHLPDTNLQETDGQFYSGDDFDNFTFGGCPVGRPYPWIFEIPRWLTENISYEGPVELPVEEVVFKWIAYLTSMTLALIGNALVVIVVAQHKKMRNRTNFYVANLAVSDLIVALGCMWVHLGSGTTINWPFGAEVCSFQTFIQVWAVTASVLFMSIIAADRFFVIVFPLKARMSNTGAAVVTITAWTVAGIVALPNLFVWKLFTIYWKDKTEMFCDAAWPRYWYETDSGQCLYHMPARSTYFVVYSALFYFLPLGVMTLAYAMIVQRLWHRKVQSSAETANRQLSVVHRRTRKKVIKMLVAVLLAFFICWTPFQVLQLYNATRSLDSAYPSYLNSLLFAAVYLAYSNSAINPVLYAWLNEAFRAAFRETLRCGAARNRVFPDYRTTPAQSRTSPQRKPPDVAQSLASASASALVCTVSTQVHLQVPHNAMHAAT